MENLAEAKTWFRSLSINEQKQYARKYLLNFEYDMLLGNSAKFTHVNRWNEIHLKLYNLVNK